MFALLAVVLTGCGNGAQEAAQAKLTPAEASPENGELASGPILGTLAFEGSELKFQPATVQVERPGRYAVTFTNVGHVDHDLIAGGTRLVAKPGQTVSGEIVVPAEGLEFACSFPGHAAAGMGGRISVNGAAGE